MKAAPVIDFDAVREAKRDAELRAEFGLTPDQTCVPLAFLVAKLLDNVRVGRARQAQRAAQ